MELDLPFRVSDQDFKKLVAILRLAVPYTGLIMTARESRAIRDEVMEFGVSQIDAGTKLEIGGYNKERKGDEQALDEEQFQIGDTRNLDEVIRWLLTRDYIPSFCTKEEGYKLTERELAKMPDGDEKESLKERLKKIREQGIRDILY